MCSLNKFLPLNFGSSSDWSAFLTCSSTFKLLEGDPESIGIVERVERGLLSEKGRRGNERREIEKRRWERQMNKGNRGRSLVEMTRLDTCQLRCSRVGVSLVESERRRGKGRPLRKSLRKTLGFVDSPVQCCS